MDAGRSSPRPGQGQPPAIQGQSWSSSQERRASLAPSFSSQPPQVPLPSLPSSTLSFSGQQHQPFRPSSVRSSSGGLASAAAAAFNWIDLDPLAVPGSPLAPPSPSFAGPRPPSRSGSPLLPPAPAMHSSNTPYYPLQPRGSSLAGAQGGGDYPVARERQSSSPLLGSESPHLGSGHHPSPPLPVHAPSSPRFQQDGAFERQQNAYYDPPSSPGLPPHSSSYFTAQQAAGVPLPPSPFSSHFPDSPHNRPASSFSAAGPDQGYRGSYYTDAGAPYSDTSSARRVAYPSGTPSPLGGDAVGLASGAPVLGYFNAPAPRSSSLRQPSFTDRNESSVWAPDDEDEKGFYSSINKGAGADQLARSASKRGRRAPWSKKRRLTVIVGLILIIAAGAVAALMVIKKKESSSGSTSSGSSADNAGSNGSSGSNSNTGSNSKPKAATTGTDGSTITMANGTTFTYQNPFGGFWSSTPFDDSAQAQNYTPPLNQPWDYSANKIFGVNVGGWLTLEPFISPAMFEPFVNAPTPAVDEYTLSQNLGTNLEPALRQHYDTFITEYDFAAIAGAGLNWVRISLPFWAVETQPGEPFLEGVAWEYFLKAVEWCRKYGLRVNLDLHAVPGSQNGWNHSGKLGTIGLLNGAMGMANAQRTQNIIRVLTEFINQPQYRNVIPMFGIINEAQGQIITPPVIRSYYLELYNMIREITGIGEGPMIAIHDGFSGNLATWDGFLSGSDRIAMDTHPYLAFSTPNNDPMGEQIETACVSWAGMVNTSMADVGFTFAGEWSLGINDCGRFLNGVGLGTRYEGTYLTTPVVGDCDNFDDASRWNATFKSQLVDLALAEMDTFQNWFFWTWKIGVSTTLGRVASPLWSYSHGLEHGYVPTDPRGYRGACNRMAAKYDTPPPAPTPFNGRLAPWMTGGAGAGTIAPTQLASYNTWPPVSLANVPGPPADASMNVALLPTWTATGAPLTLTASPTPTGYSGLQQVLASPYFTPVAGCSYMDPWSGAGVPQPTATC